MSYVVLARKWRPRQFDEVVGQEHVARTLSNAIEQDRVAHSFLFTGARGVGKTSTARILAKALNCVNGPTPTPCNECSSCTEITSGQSVDVFEIDGASNRGINEIRELRDSVRYAPSRSKYKVYIIDEVHMLTTEAFNALLKTLEEPPPHVKFIFATTEPQKIPVTILSRCQRYDFKRIGQQDIVKHLELLCKAEKIQAERSALQLIARQAAGGMRDALSLLDQIISFAGTTVTEKEVTEILGVANRQHLFELSDAIIRHDAERALVVLDEVNRYGYDLPQFSSELVGHFRDLMVTSVVQDAQRVTDLTATEIDAALVQIEGIPGELLHRYFSVMVAGSQEMTRSSYPKLILEMTLVRLAQLEPLVGLDLLVDRLAALEAEFDGELPAQHLERTVPTASRLAREPRPEAVPRVPAEDPRNRVTPPAPAPVVETPAPALIVETPAPAPVVEAPTPAPVVETAAPAPVVETVPVAPVVEPSVEEPEETYEMPSEPDFDDVPHSAGVGSIQAQPKRSVADDDDDDLDEVLEAEAVVEQVARKPAAPTPPEDSKPEPVTNISVAPKAEVAQPATEWSDADEVPVDSVDIHKMSGSELEPLSAMQRRDRLVEVVRLVSKPLAAVLEYGYVESFENKRIEFSLADKYLAIINDKGRVQTLQEVVTRFLGADWVVDVLLRDDAKGKRVTTISEEREREREARKASLEAELMGSVAVTRARELFNVPEDKVRVQVRLFDEI